MLRLKSISLKLFITYISVLVVSFAIFSTTSYWLFRNDLIEKHQDALFKRQETIAQFIKTSYQKGMKRETLKSALELSVARQNQAFYLYNQSGNLLYQVGQVNNTIAVDKQLIQEVIQGNHLIRKVKPEGNQGQGVLLVASPITGTDSMEERAIVMVSFGFETEFDRGKHTFMLGLIISLLITGLCILYISRKMTAPLREMNQNVLQFAKGNFTSRVRVESQDEVGQLAHTFNYMADELANLDQMRKDFVANLSHDLRSPLTSIHGFVTAFLDGAVPENRKRHYFTIIKDETERLIKLVEDLLDIARMEAGQLELLPIDFNLSEGVRKVIARMWPQFEKQQVSIQFISEVDEDVYVVGDPDRIDQVLVNLLQNALQFSNIGQSIEVSLRRKELACLSVRDHGPGMEPEEMKYIWQRFYKVDKARSRKGGTGIGLSIVKHILDLHSAPVEMESNVGEGTTCTFCLPLSVKKIDS